MPLPAVYTSPPGDADQLVNLPTWLGVDNWVPQGASASEAGLTVNVTAVPQSVTWRMGTNQPDDPTICHGPGARYDLHRREEDQHTDCSFVYRRSSATKPDLRYSASATMTWDVSWAATNGETGSLGVASRTSNFTMRVAEGQAIITWAGR